jgi:hypothetical protein
MMNNGDVGQQVVSLLEMPEGIRVRAKISQSTKGVLTFDCTVEGSVTVAEDVRREVREQVLSELDILMDELKKRCDTT